MLESNVQFLRCGKNCMSVIDKDFANSKFRLNWVRCTVHCLCHSAVLASGLVAPLAAWWHRAYGNVTCLVCRLAVAPLSFAAKRNSLEFKNTMIQCA